MATSKITRMAVKPCTCVHVYQDRTYGNGLRLHTEGKTSWRCTVCATKKVK